MQTTRSGVCIVRESALVNNFLKRKRREAAYEFGQRIYIRYGNGVETTYNYKKETRLLDVIETLNDRGNHYQNIKYTFDKVGNILNYTACILVLISEIIFTFICSSDTFLSEVFLNLKELIVKVMKRNLPHARFEKDLKERLLCNLEACVKKIF